MAERPLSEKQLDLLQNFAYSGLDGWVRPMDLGGRDGTSHSSVLTQLERRGLVESKVRSSGVRGSKVYKLTEAGYELGRRED